MQGIAAGVSEDAVCKTLHSSTARRYLKKQGFRWKDLTKGLYQDGHERQDVVDYRENKFLPLMAELKPKMVEFYLDQDLVRAHVPDTVGPEERPIVPTYQDESTYNANDGLSEGWPIYLRVSGIVSAYNAKFPALNLEDVRLLAQGDDMVHDYVDQERETDAERESDADGDLDADAEVSAAERGTGGVCAPLDPCKPPLTKVPRGRPPHEEENENG
jgi:hypothetical protein